MLTKVPYNSQNCVFQSTVYQAQHNQSFQFHSECREVSVKKKATTWNHSDKFVIQETFGEVKNSMFGYNTDIIRE
jgi:hypothetical protein